MKKMQWLVLLGFVSSAFIGVHSFSPSPGKPVYIPESKQRNGNADSGFVYLTTGDYVKSGIPLDFFRAAMGPEKNNSLQRAGLNANISHEYTVVTAPNGEYVVAPNCLQCHAQVFGGKLVMGMGNTFADFTKTQKLNPQAYTFLENLLKTGSPKKYEASKNFIETAKTIGPLISTRVRGVNPADRLAAVLVAHRDPQSFAWLKKATMDIPEEVIPSDVPPWWLLKKKHAMFYNGFGRGDFGRFLMASNLLTVNDTSESREVDSHINDVLAYIYTLKPPPYPGTINRPLARKGEKIFAMNCGKCHGSYGSDAQYPNLLIPESVIKTDSFLFKSNYQNPQFVRWFNNSWFARGDHPARLEPFNGYIAPPLDGIWCTAPYLHNGSVPTLEGVLNSSKRPRYWQRDFNHPQYDYTNPGWKYTEQKEPAGTNTYNTDLPGYGNYGHYFGDKLSPGQRKAVIEYLKTI